MSKFRVGDVCEVVWTYWPKNNYMVGRQVTVLEVGVEFSGEMSGYRTDGVIADIKEWVTLVPEQLRLKRPPSWDSWLYDTSDVEREQRTQAPGQEPSHAQP